jgi:hypothetical protein
MSQTSSLQSDQRTLRSCNCRRYGRKLIHGLAALVLLLAVAYDAAEAEDEKVFPGSMCVRLGTSSDGIYYPGAGGIANAGTTAVTVVCPIVRDNVGSSYNSVNVTVQDLSPSANVSCAVHAVSPSGGSIWHAYPSNPLPAGYFSTQLYTLNIGPVSQGKGASFFVTCDLPPVAGGQTSGVFLYHMVES